TAVVLGGGMLATSRRLGGADAKADGALLAGEGVVDVSPPKGITLGGFHYSPGRPRLVTAIRQKPEARALVIRRKDTSAAIVSLDMLNVSFDMVRNVQAAVEKEVKIPAAHVRLCATHTHSMPSIAFNRQWGDNHPEYEAKVVSEIVQAVSAAQRDLSGAALYCGTSRVEGGNVNRTARMWKTERGFGEHSTDAERWLDTVAQVLHFERGGGKKSLLWYNFSAHPTSFNDGQAGPDWPGLVQRILREREMIAPAYLQGHIGDVAPTGEEQTAIAVADAIGRAVESSKRVEVDAIRVATQNFRLPYNLELFKSQIEQYRRDPAGCARGEWVDAAFAKDWFDTFASKYDMSKTELPITLAVMRIGSVGLAFHPAELYSVYGLIVQRDSPLKPTMVIGYADGYVGYVTDPAAYAGKEYAAVVVPKILNHPPFSATAGRKMTSAMIELLKQVAA
ncbi:MAG: neutral/alkaline non-lysosomal ceramidase N-terminal domain-containing protein, partial [Pirellulales bacterium]